MAIIKTLKESKILSKGRPRQTIYPVTSSDAVIVPNRGKLTTVLSKVAFSNNYNDLDNLPANISAFNNDVGYLTSFTETDPTVPLWAKQNTKPSYNYSEILNTPILATVATSGNYNDLINKPTIPIVPTNVSAFTNDVGYLTQHQSLADYYTKTEVNTALGGKANSADLASVATSGSYNDLNNKPNFSEVATSGDYDDLLNKPTIPTVPTFKTINSEAITGSGDITLQTPLTFDSTPTANSTNPVTSGGIKTAIDNTAELHVVPTQGTSLLLYAAAGYIIDQSQINTTCDGILTALKNGKKLYFELDNREDGGAKGTYGAVYADYVEPENESTVINIIVNHSLLAFYNVTLTKAYGATNWVITYVNKIAQEKPDVVNVEGSGNAITNWSVNGDIVTLTKGLTFQEELVSGTSIKTINNVSVLGSGNIDTDDVVHGTLRGSDFVEGDWTNEGGTWTYSIPLSGGVITPNENKIYVDVSTNKIYRWKGSYVQIGGGDVTEMTNAEVDTMMTN